VTTWYGGANSYDQVHLARAAQTGDDPLYVLSGLIQVPPEQEHEGDGELRLRAQRSDLILRECVRAGEAVKSR